MPNTVVEFHGPQEAFFKAGPQPTLFMGGVGSGKSYIGILKMLFLLDQYPGSRGVIVRQRFAQLKKTTAASLWELLPQDKVARRNDNEGVVNLTNGSRLDLIHLDKADSLSNLKSMELNFAYVDQAEDISAEAFDTLIERIGRWSAAMMRGGYPEDWPYKTDAGGCIPPSYIFLSCYSPGYDHWLTSRFWENGEERERYRKEGYLTLIGSTRQNPNLTKQYIRGRLAMGKHYVERLVDATAWGANEGAIFDLLDESILEPTEELLYRIKHKMRLHRVMDHGEAVPTAVLWYATDSDHNVFFYREYSRPGLLVSDHRLNVFTLSQSDFAGDFAPSYYSNYADPAIFAKSRGRGVNQAPQWSVSDEWSERRIVDGKTAVFWRPANNNEAMTINRVREYMRMDPRHSHPVTREKGAPRVYFLKRTPDYPEGIYETLVDIRSAKRIEIATNADGTKLFGDERDPKIRDHCLDCIRYSIGMRPALGVVEAEPEEGPGMIRIDKYYELQERQDLDREIEQRRNWHGDKEIG